MDIIVSPEHLKNALKIISMIAPQSGNKFMLSNYVLISTLNDNFCEIVFTDSSISVIIKIPCTKINRNGKICLDIKALQTVVQYSNNDIQIITDNNVCMIKGDGSYKAKIPTYDYNDYPIITTENKDFDESKIFNLLDIQTGIKNVYYAIGQNSDSRYVFKGLFFDGKEIVATDGYRLAKSELPFDTNINQSILPHKILHCLSQINEPKIEIFVKNNNNIVCFRTKNTEIQVTKIEGNYPQYQKIIPKYSNYIFLQKQDLINGIRSVLLDGFSKNNEGQLILEAYDNKFNITWNNKFNGTEATKKIPCYIFSTTANNTVIKVSLHHKYILECLNSIPETYIKIYYSDLEKDYLMTPVVITGTNTSEISSGISSDVNTANPFVNNTANDYDEKSNYDEEKDYNYIELNDELDLNAEIIDDNQENTQKTSKKIRIKHNPNSNIKTLHIIMPIKM